MVYPRSIRAPLGGGHPGPSQGRSGADSGPMWRRSWANRGSAGARACSSGRAPRPRAPGTGVRHDRPSGGLGARGDLQVVPRRHREGGVPGLPHLGRVPCAGALLDGRRLWASLRPGWAPPLAIGPPHLGCASRRSARLKHMFGVVAGGRMQSRRGGRFHRFGWAGAAAAPRSPPCLCVLALAVGFIVALEAFRELAGSDAFERSFDAALVPGRRPPLPPPCCGGRAAVRVKRCSAWAPRRRAQESAHGRRWPLSAALVSLLCSSFASVSSLGGGLHLRHLGRVWRGLLFDRLGRRSGLLCSPGSSECSHRKGSLCVICRYTCVDGREIQV